MTPTIGRSLAAVLAIWAYLALAGAAAAVPGVDEPMQHEDPFRQLPALGACECLEMGVRLVDVEEAPRPAGGRRAWRMRLRWRMACSHGEGLRCQGRVKLGGAAGRHAWAGPEKRDRVEREGLVCDEVAVGAVGPHSVEVSSRPRQVVVVVPAYFGCKDDPIVDRRDLVLVFRRGTFDPLRSDLDGNGRADHWRYV